jgi:DNA polymerase-1|tara:strand:- start:85 stop:1041 length:957 start_codon:yes stop_codon:yes gene_type:complete
MLDKRPVMLVDGLNVHTRHFVANPSINDSGQQVGGVLGFLKGLQLLIDRFTPREVHVIWESGGSPRRRSIFQDYKSKRRPQKLNRYYGNDIPDTVENRNYQIALTIELLKKTPINQIYVSDCEADDVIGYLAGYRYLNDVNMIISSDKDFYQLISESILQWSPGQKRCITTELIRQRFHTSAQNFCTTRCFIGDISDGIPGIKGAGFKTMAKRFPELQSEEKISVEEILTLSQQRSEKSKIKLFKLINESPHIVRRNWKLMYLGTQNLAATQIQKINAKIDTFSPSYNKINLMRILLREGLNSFDADSFFMSLNSALR